MAYKEPVNQVLATRTPLMLGVPGPIFLVLSGLGTIVFMTRNLDLLIVLFLLYVVCVAFTARDPAMMVGVLDQATRPTRSSKRFLP